VKKKNWTKTAKKPRIKIDRTEYKYVDKSILPPDAEYKGYRIIIVQNIKFSTDNVEYKLEYYHSESEKKTYEAELPDDIRREFGTELKAFIVYLYFGCRVTENKIKTILEESGIIISEGQISNILTKEKKEEMTKEKEDIFVAGTTLLIDNEIMWISEVNRITRTLTVIRGYKSGEPYFWSTASTHTGGSIIHRPNHISCPLKQILIPTSWLESIVRQVVSGYVRDQNENLILNGIKIVISSGSTSGVGQMNPVNPTTAFYQVFVKNAKYDNRYLLVNQEGKTFDLSYSGYGLPAIIDGTVKVPSPQDMHFWKPNQICGKSVAYVGSIVSY
jgi:hypothetical protein